MPAPAAGSSPPSRLSSLELLVLRHAEAERKGVTDFDRALTKKGREDATNAGRRLGELQLTPDAVFSSPAARAIVTARLAVAALGPNAPAVQPEPQVYDASREILAKVLGARGGAARRLLLVGHNPGLSDLASWLCNLPSGWSLGKSATAQLRLRATWKDLSKGCGRLIDVHEELGPPARPPKPPEEM